MQKGGAEKPEKEKETTNKCSKMCLINWQVSPHSHKRLLLLAPAMEKCRMNHSPNKSVRKIQRKE